MRKKIKLDQTFYNQFNEDFLTKIKNTPQLIQSLIKKDFPDEETTIEHWGSNSLAGEFLKNNSSQILELISMDYEDFERFEGAEDESDEERNRSFDKVLKKDKEDNAHFFIDIVALIEEELQLSSAKYISDNLFDDEKLVDTLPNPDSNDILAFKAAEYFFDSQTNLSAYWELQNKIAFVQYAYSYGDGDFQLSLTMGVIKKHEISDNLWADSKVLAFKTTGMGFPSDSGTGYDLEVAFTIEYSTVKGKIVNTKTEKVILSEYVKQLQVGMILSVMYEAAVPKKIKTIKAFDGIDICRP